METIIAGVAGADEDKKYEVCVLMRDLRSNLAKVSLRLPQTFGISDSEYVLCGTTQRLFCFRPKFCNDYWANREVVAIIHQDIPGIDFDSVDFDDWSLSLKGDSRASEASASSLFNAPIC
ncbi:MAG: hypothetical protein M0R33_15400 [Methylomonas sp.]|jgi:hypothetical protein|uniref:hypothetical protein n=1 Tax=Methylomonas sp. TaxID=418 RepID=UPI0025F2B164|nr:hypothetical protein [Methylomonas sp.]MCK9607828.1 hypothetical protein [Methylomonas sp.]